MFQPRRHVCWRQATTASPNSVPDVILGFLSQKSEDKCSCDSHVLIELRSAPPASLDLFLACWRMPTFYLVLLLASWIRHSSSQCYNPDGSEIALGTYQPCFPSDRKTHCCDVGTTCLTTGLCLVKLDSSFNTGKYSLSRISTKVGGIPRGRDLDFRRFSIRWTRLTQAM